MHKLRPNTLRARWKHLARHQTMVNVWLICHLGWLRVGRKRLPCVIMEMNSAEMRSLTDSPRGPVRWESLQKPYLRADHHHQQTQDIQRRDISEHGRHSLKAVLKSIHRYRWHTYTLQAEDLWQLFIPITLVWSYYLEKISSKWKNGPICRV